MVHMASLSPHELFLRAWRGADFLVTETEGCAERCTALTLLLLFICSVVSDPLRPHAKLLCLWDFPGKHTGVGCHCLLRRSS